MLRSIRSKILVGVLSVTLVTAAALSIVFYMKSAAIIQENYIRNLKSRMQQSIDRMGEDLSDIYQNCVKASFHQELISLTERYKDTGKEELLEEVAVQLQEISVRNPMISSVYLIIPEEDLTVTSQEYPVYKRGLPDGLAEEVIRWDTEHMEPAILQDYLHGGNGILTFIEPVISENMQTLGYLLVNVEENRIYYHYLDHLQENGAMETVILSKDGRIIADRQLGNMGKKPESPKEDENTIVRIQVEEKFTGAVLRIGIEQKAVLEDLNQLRVFFLLILLGFSVIALLLASWMSHAMYAPLRKLTKAMEAVGEGNLALRSDVETKDEIGTLSREFNRMLDQVNELIERLIEQERLKKDAELEALQYQITPHFMYNTLNSIKFAALIKGEKEIGALLGDFVELLQASVSKKGVFLTVADELHILENYLNLQRFRYEQQFEVLYEIESRAQSCLLPRLLLQPLVENALMHGIDMKTGNGKLIITARTEGARLILTVEDNGRGMEPGQIQELLESSVKKTSGLSAVGIPNIRDRLKLYYGEEGGIIITSSSDGTAATVFLPVRRD